MEQFEGLTDLGSQTVTDTELRGLLVRLGEREMGGSDQPTISDIAEATGRPPEEIALLLDELREVSRQDELSSRIDRLEEEVFDHLERIEDLEERPAVRTPYTVTEKMEIFQVYLVLGSIVLAGVIWILYLTFNVGVPATWFPKPQ